MAAKQRGRQTADAGKSDKVNNRPFSLTDGPKRNPGGVMVTPANITMNNCDEEASGGIENISFESLFNISGIQHLQDMLAESWGVAILLTRPDGTAITRPSNFTYFCSEFIRRSEKGCRNCQISDATLGRHNPSGPTIQKCLSAGLWGAGVSITAGGRHIANWLIGQVRNEAQNKKEIRQYARAIGVDEAMFCQAFLRVPVMPQDKFEQIARTIFVLADQLSAVAYQNIQKTLYIAERKRAEKALRESEKKYRRLHESMTEAFVSVDMNGRIWESNRAFQSMVGYSEEELRQLTYPDITPEKWHTLEKSVVEEQILVQGHADSYEKEYRKRDGTVFPVELNTFLIRNEAGNPAGMWAIVRDITERKKIEEERRKIEVRMREVQKLESLGVLAGGIAHDFNNLLMAVLGRADLALLSLSEDSPAYEHVEEIIRASHRASELCQQMLAYSGKGRFVVKRHDLSEIVREMGQMLDVSVSKNALIRYYLADNLPAVEADATQIRQVVMNLIINASDALDEMRGIITITTGVAQCDEAFLAESCYLDDKLPGGTYVYLEVSDTGCGMDPETQSRIFDPFFSRKFTGRGLGLAAVLGIVRGHKGAIKVSSEAGKGTTFKILLPAVDWKPGDKAKSEEPVVLPQIGGTILLVDDDPFIRDVASEMLRQVGFQVLTAANGLEGLKVFKIHGKKIACVILDLTMPEMDGEEAFLELREMQSDVRVILSSGYNEQEATKRFVGRGLAGFIQKPYTMKGLRSELQRVLG